MLLKGLNKQRFYASRPASGRLPAMSGNAIGWGQCPVKTGCSRSWLPG